jgi:bifunctional non-homologous end joining protein LigD
MEMAGRAALHVEVGTPFLERTQGKLQERAGALIERRPELKGYFDDRPPGDTPDMPFSVRDVPFSTVVGAAREMRDRLNDLGLVSFCKTTGGKGLHVVTPLAIAKRSTLSWPQAKGFAHDFCLQMARDNPSLYLIKMSKSLRNGRIFLDYLRNDRMATAVAPLSPRARPGATVSMPITWAQVKADLDPKRFTVRTLPTLLAKSTAWKDYSDGLRPLEHAIKQLSKVTRAA